MSETPAAIQITNRSAALAIVIWVGLQTVVLVLVVARSPLWMGMNDAVALQFLLAVQIAASSLLVGALMPDWVTSVCACIAAIPLIYLAGIVTAAPGVAIVRAITVDIIWLMTLALFASVARTGRGRAVVATLASVASIGGALLLYSRNEFAPQQQPGATFFGPLTAALSIIHSPTRGAWLLLALLLVVAVIAALVAARLRSIPRQLIHI